jgi:hypothetical protein
MTTTLRDLIDLDLEVGPPVGAGTLRLLPLFSSSPAPADSLCGPVAEAAKTRSVVDSVRRRNRRVQADTSPEM